MQPKALRAPLYRSLRFRASALHMSNGFLLFILQSQGASCLHSLGLVRDLQAFGDNTTYIHYKYQIIKRNAYTSPGLKVHQNCVPDRIQSSRSEEHCTEMHRVHFKR